MAKAMGFLPPSEQSPSGSRDPRGESPGMTLALTPEELAALPVVRADGAPDIWLNAWQKQRWDILWIFECLKHGRRFALLGRSATRPGARARRRQGVIRLPPEHRECPHRIWREDEWELKVPDPLAYIAAPAGFGGVSRLHGAEVEAEAICRHKGFEARLRLLQTRIPGATIYRTAVVEFRFDSLAPRSRRDPAFEPHYGVPWEEAVRRLRELVEENGLEEIRDPLPPDVRMLFQDMAAVLGQMGALSSSERRVSPREALAMLEETEGPA
jgi:hypothetical protein